MKADIYLKEVLEQTPRLLSLLDRNPISKTYGCFDRQYWHYTVVDFPCARSQEAALTLALLYRIDHPENPYYKNKLILNWINAALEFWCRMQEKNGSFNEWYPHENSFVATVFSSYAISEVLLQIGDEIRERSRVISSLEKSADWFMKKDEDRAVNQQMGAILALHNISLLTGDEKYRQSSEGKIDFVLRNQDAEGWFPEYGGADVGYLSLAIDYLAKYYQKTRNPKLPEILKKSVEFISHFVHPDLTFGGEYGSRNTTYLIPDGFEILAGEVPMAALIAQNIRRSMELQRTISPRFLDDRYLAYITYTYLQAYVDSGDVSGDVAVGAILPNTQELSKNFPGAGLWIFGNKHIYLVANYKKGGTCRIFFKDITGSPGSLHDCGIMVKTHGGGRLTSSWLTDKNSVEFSDKNKNEVKNKIKINGNLWAVPGNYLTPTKSVCLRTFQMTLGKSTRVGYAVKNTLRDRLITETNSADMEFSREIRVEDDLIKITDGINAPDRIRELIIGGGAAHIYTPSSRYFLNPDLDSLPVILGEKELQKYRDSDRLSIVRVYDMQAKLIKCEISTD